MGMGGQFLYFRLSYCVINIYLRDFWYHQVQDEFWLEVSSVRWLFRKGSFKCSIIIPKILWTNSNYTLLPYAQNMTSEREFQSESSAFPLAWSLPLKSADLLLSCPVTNLLLSGWAEKAENLLTPAWQVPHITRLNILTLDLTTDFKSFQSPSHSSLLKSITLNIERYKLT